MCPLTSGRGAACCARACCATVLWWEARLQQGMLCSVQAADGFVPFQWQGLYDVVAMSLVGSVLSNLLLVLGAPPILFSIARTL